MPTFYVNASGNDSWDGSQETWGGVGNPTVGPKLTYGGAFLASANNDTIIIQSMELNESIDMTRRHVRIDGYVVLDGQGILLRGILPGIHGDNSLCPLGADPTNSGGRICLEVRNFVDCAIYYGNYERAIISGVWAHSVPEGREGSNGYWICYSEFYDCIFSDCTVRGMRTSSYYADDYGKVVRCLFYNNPIGIEFRNWTSLTRSEMYSCIIDPGSQSSALLVKVQFANVYGNEDGLISNWNNLRFVGGATCEFHTTTGISSLAGWRTASAEDGDSIDVDPLYLDATENLFALDRASQSLVSGFRGGRQGPLPAAKAFSPNVSGSTFSTWTLTNCELDGSNHIILSAAQSVATAESPIMTFSQAVIPGGFGCLGAENYPTEVFDADDGEGPPNHRTVEFRSGDTDIEVTGASYTKIPRGKSIGDVLSTAKLKWQARVTLRNNGTGG